MRVSFLGLALVVTSTACGSQPAAPTSAPPPSADAGASKGADAGRVEAERPFAGSTAEATELISTAVDKKHREIATCIRSFRARMNMAHDRLAVSFGIDQEGRLLGVTSKGKEDAQLKTCIETALKSAPFPRSNSGVITVTKTYEEIVL